MAILFCDDTYRADKIFALLQANLPQVDLRKYPEIGNPAEIEQAIILRPKPGSLQNLPNLKLIFTIGAGVDGIIHDKTLPDVPILRNTDPHLMQSIRDYVLYHALHYFRYFDRYERQRHSHEWKQYAQRKHKDFTIGFMGLGEMGLTAAKSLQSLGFPIRSWTNTPKNVDGITSFSGKEELPAFLSGTNLLINILPLTDLTRGILNSAVFNALPRGSSLINIGRGTQLVEEDLLAALESGQLEAATLDVFTNEPLLPDNPFWSHPKLTITPHIASLTDYQNIARNILAAIERMEKGLPLPKFVDREKQY